MRTTISIDDGFAEDLKRRARSEGISLSAFIEKSLRQCLADKPMAKKPPPFRLITVKGAARPGFDLNRGAELIDAEDEASVLKAGR